MTTTQVPPSSLRATLDVISHSPLSDIPRAAAARVVRRIVDRQTLTPKLEVAAFNSAM